ncbi:hypothetical protein As57867_017862, partial [Aphanomyces stellatus]
MSSNARHSTSLDDIRGMRVAKSTKAGYRSGLNQIKKWIVAHGSPDMLASDGSIDLSTFKYSDFLEFIQWSYQNTSNKPGTLASYRSAIKDYYKRKGMDVPIQYDDDMKDLFQGECDVTMLSKRSVVCIKESGKRPLGYSMYESLSLESLKLMDGGFAHLFLTLSWNLMCRSMSTQTVLFDHISFEEDAIGVVFHKSKTDQSGEKSRDPRHIYANPFKPATCVFLALGVYLASHPQLAPGQLFPGGTQRDRFGKSLARLAAGIASPESGAIGTHSIRKGVATFACSGSTSGPSMASVCLRCGWTLGHVLERYIHYERAGDQYLGRVVAGLPNHKSDFAVLPPHFPLNADDNVRQIVAIVFPQLAMEIHLWGVLSFALASLVYHFEFLVQILPPTHPLLSSAIFANLTIMATLKAHVVLSSTRHAPTGIPPHVDLFKIIERNHIAIQNLPDAISGKLQHILQEHIVSSGSITRQFLESALSDFVDRIAPRADAQATSTPATHN